MLCYEACPTNGRQLLRAAPAAAWHSARQMQRPGQGAPRTNALPEGTTLGRPGIFLRLGSAELMRARRGARRAGRHPPPAPPAAPPRPHGGSAHGGRLAGSHNARAARRNHKPAAAACSGAAQAVHPSAQVRMLRSDHSLVHLPSESAARGSRTCGAGHALAVPTCCRARSWHSCRRWGAAPCQGSLAAHWGLLVPVCANVVGMLGCAVRASLETRQGKTSRSPLRACTGTPSPQPAAPCMHGRTARAWALGAGAAAVPGRLLAWLTASQTCSSERLPWASS